MLVQVAVGLLSGLGPYLTPGSQTSLAQVIAIAAAKLGWALVLLVCSPCACGLSNQVVAFQFLTEGSSVLLISLRAGGTGLNLTRATHVIHYDRWWNPAVEDQATDRAYRIGQTKNVMVHKMLCSNTLEERIAQRLDEKRALAESVVTSGEGWITELSDSDLRSLIALGDDLMAEA